MKKMTLCFLLAAALIAAVGAFSEAALTVPTVIPGQGTIGAAIIFDDGLCIDWNYGLSPELGLKLELGVEGGYEVGIKYELNNSMALVGGIVGFDSYSCFYGGVIGSTPMASNLLGLAEFSVIAGDVTVFHYELGLKHNLDNRLSLRFGALGYTGDGYGFVRGQIGITYAY
ncbi:MAG: hypothetical protein ACM3WV_09750 [Bacillota bacterium]